MSPMRPVDGRIAPRSGLASKNFIDTGAGVIDADYRGMVKVLLFNFSSVDFEGKFSFSFPGFLCWDFGRGVWGVECGGRGGMGGEGNSGGGIRAVKRREEGGEEDFIRD